MRDASRLRARLIALFLAGAAGFGYPLLAAFNVPATIAGVPVLYAYLFAAWLVLIAALLAVMRRS
jgi:hypothetical protein